MANIITIANMKGGVGKTTTALNLCDALGRCQRNVLLVDMDPQCNATSSFGVESEGVPTILDLFMGNIETVEAIQQTIFGDIIPGDIMMNDYVDFFYAKKDRFKILKKILQDVEDQYDYIIIDTHPGIDIYTKNAFAVSDGVILPINAEGYSIDGLKNLIPIIERAGEEVNPNLKLLGVLLTRYDIRRSFDKDTWNYLKETDDFPVFSTPIRVTQQVVVAEACKMSIFDVDPSGNASIDYANFTTEVIRLFERS